MAEIFEEDARTDGDTGTGRAIRGLFPFLRTHRKRLLGAFALLALSTGLSLTWPWLIQRAIDGPLGGAAPAPAALPGAGPHASVPAGGGALRALVLSALAVLLLQGTVLVLQWLQRMRLESIGQDVMFEMKTRLFGHILSQDVTFFDRHPVGRLMARVESDAESLRLLFTNTVVLVAGDLLMILGIWGVMLAKDARLAAAVLLFAPVLLGSIWVFHKLTTHRFLKLRKLTAEVTATLTEFLHGMSIVQIFHRGAYARSRVYRASERKFVEDAGVNISICVFFNSLSLLEYLKIGTVLLVGARFGVSPGTIVLFILLIWKEFEPIARTADQLGSFQKGLAGARRIFALLSVRPAFADPPRPAEWSGLADCIRFEHVWFRYPASGIGTDGNGPTPTPGGPAEAEESWVLRDVTFEIPAGRKIALVGSTGGGKSTVIALLLRMHEPQRGRITVDGIDIRDLTAAQLRNRLALVLQDIVLFPGDIEANITLESETISPERARAAARTVAAEGFIAAMPQGYRTVVSEKGANLSRGQRQLLSFARALARDPDVLILDEATSSVDPETEREIQDSLARLMAGRTSLVVAHRLSTILAADRILVLRQGEIAEEGTHPELLARGGWYARLYRLQTAATGESPAQADEGVLDHAV